MNSVTVLTHFTDPNWPMVNKLSTICKCLGVTMIHCPTLEKLRATVRQPFSGRVLFFTDEGMAEVVQELEIQAEVVGLEVALFMLSPLSNVAKKVTDLKCVKYLIGVTHPDSYGRELAILIKKFADRDILDLEKYLGFGCRLAHRSVSSPQTKREAVEAISNYILNLGDPGYAHPFGLYARLLAEIADELLLNAVFNANPRLIGADRSKPFELSKAEEISISWGYDGDYFGVSVRDPFGRFTSDSIISYISAQRRMDEIITAPSGGLGLKFIFERAHQIVANVRKAQVTEVIALVKFSNRMLDYERQQKSFFFFNDTDT